MTPQFLKENSASVCVFILFAALILFSAGEINWRIAGSVVDVGTVTLCINHPPVMDISSCDATGNTYNPYTCTVSATDFNNNSISYSENTTLFIMGNDTGNVAFIPTEEGIFSILFTAEDNSSCDNGIDEAAV